MSQGPRSFPRWRPRRLKVWQRLFIAICLFILLSFCSTLFSDHVTPRVDDDSVALDPTAEPGSLREGESVSAEGSGWTEPVYAYVLAPEGEYTVPFYNEALAETARCGRGTYIEMESLDPFVAENGKEYYHVYYKNQYGYILTDYITDDRSDVVQETQVYVRTAVNLLTEPDSLEIGPLAQKGELLRIVGYDYIRDNGTVNMYEVKLGTEIGWVYAQYVVTDYAAALENWNNDNNAYRLHSMRGDTYGGGNAADLDYWPHEKGNFASQGNVMPDSVYALYVPAEHSTPETIKQYLELAEGTAINTFVLTIFDGGALAYPSSSVAEYGLLDAHVLSNSTVEQYAEVINMIRDAGYYIVGRITAFNDYALAKAHPEWSIIENATGAPLYFNGSYWPSVYSRDVWRYKVGLAVEAVDLFGFNEIQFDYIRFPDFIINYERRGEVNLHNDYDESKAQAVQRFLMYASDALHAHGAYISGDVFGETSNDYVAPYGQYWPAITNIVDVISGMPYPDHYSSHYRNGTYYRYYMHPYATLNDWAIHVNLRQNECATPAIVRTWIQTWNDPGYNYDDLAITREILGLYDADITGGYMPWYGNGSLYVSENLGTAIDHDYYALYLEAQAQEMDLSKYMQIPTGEEPE